MRNFFAVLMLLTLVSSAALAGIRMYPTSGRFEFTDCASGGSAAQTVRAGTYLTRFITEDIWICYAATCATGGDKFGSGTVMMLTFPSATQSVSCRSASSTGDLILTRAEQ